MALNRLRNKLQSCKGFTLVEMVATLAIVVLVTMVVGTGMAFAATEFARSMELSEAKVLQSTLCNAIGNELTATQEIHSASKTVTGTVEGKDHTVYELGTYFSKSFGGNCELKAIKDGAPASYGQIYQVNSENESDKQLLLSSSTYTRDLQASVSIEYADGPNEPENGRFSVTIGIYSERGDLLIEDTVFDFIPYSKPAVDGEGGGGSGGGHSGGGSSGSSSSGGSSSGGGSGNIEPTAGTPVDTTETSYSTVLTNWSGFTWRTMADASGTQFMAAVQGDGQIGLINYSGKYYKPIQQGGSDSTDFFRSESWATPFVVSHLGDGHFYNHGYGDRQWVAVG